MLAPAVPAPNPVAEGIRFAVLDRNGNLLWQRIVPGGAATSRSDVGWRLSTGGHVATYRDPDRLQGDIVKATVRSSTRTPGLFTVTIKGKAGDFQIQPGKDPVQLIVVLGNQSRAAMGQCSSLTFNESTSVRPRCEFSRSGSTFVCR